MCVGILYYAVAGDSKEFELILIFCVSSYLGDIQSKRRRSWGGNAAIVEIRSLEEKKEFLELAPTDCGYTSFSWGTTTY